MSNKKISELPVWTQASRGDLLGTEEIPMVMGDETITIKLSEIAAFGVRPLQNLLTNFTFDDAMRSKWLRCSSTTPITATIPTAIDVSWLVYTGIQGGAGQVTFEGVSGIVINTPFGYKAKTRAKGAAFTLVQIATNTWDLFGDLEQT